MDWRAGFICQNEVALIMAKNKRWYLISYDVRDPKRLRKTARHLEGYGARLQYSLFRCRLSKREVERLRWELGRILAKEDSLLIIGLCHHCASKVNERNNNALPESKGYYIV